MRPGPGGKRGPGGDRGDRGEREERVNLDSIKLRTPAFSPFASFFKTKQAEKDPEKES
jgi:hypothetical protein